MFIHKFLLAKKMAKLEADLVEGSESNRELERKIAETKRKNDDLEAQLRAQNTEERDKARIEVKGEGINALRSKISGLETQIQFERENKTAESVKLRADLNRTMTWVLKLNGWSYLAKTASWYKVINGGLSFDKAEAYCASRKSHLVSIHSQEENDFVWELAKTVQPFPGFWIGLKRNPNKENAFEWTDGSSVDFTNWGAGEPGSKTHAFLWSGDGNWLAYAPTELGHICKIRSQF